MTVLNVWVVVNAWYNMDAYSPGTAMEWDDVEMFSNEQSATALAEELTYYLDKQIEEKCDMGSNRWLEKDSYFVQPREIKILDRIGESE